MGLGQVTAPFPITIHTSAIIKSLGVHLESMIAAQMTAYPTHWSDDDRRELAEQHLFAARKPNYCQCDPEEARLALIKEMLS